MAVAQSSLRVLESQLVVTGLCAFPSGTVRFFGAENIAWKLFLVAAADDVGIKRGDV